VTLHLPAAPLKPARAMNVTNFTMDALESFSRFFLVLVLFLSPVEIENEERVRE